MGLVGRGAISTPGRAFIDGADDGVAIAAMARSVAASSSRSRLLSTTRSAQAT